MGTITDSAVVQPSEEHLATTIDDETVILHMESGTYFGLNAVATEIWEQLDETPTVGELHEELAAQYDVDEAQLREDLDDVLQDMSEKGLVTFEDG